MPAEDVEPTADDRRNYNILDIRVATDPAAALRSLRGRGFYDLIVYASWWSLGRPGSRPRNVRDDITFIRSFPGVADRSLVVSEFGISYLEPDQGRRTVEAVEAFSSAGIPIAMYWQECGAADVLR